MRRVTLTTSRPDCLELHIGRDWQRVAMWGALLLLAVAPLVLIEADGALWVIAFFVNLALAPALAVAVSRGLWARSRTLVRTGGRLLLDGEAIEIARVELRVLKYPITHRPRGYALSLWVMTATGPEDVPIGHSTQLLEAAQRSGQVEDFVQRANVKLHRHA